MAKHTAEPWQHEGDHLCHYPTGKGDGGAKIMVACEPLPTSDAPLIDIGSIRWEIAMANLDRAAACVNALAPGGAIEKLAEAADTVQDTYEHALHLDDRDLNVGVCALRAALAAVREVLPK